MKRKLGLLVRILVSVGILAYLFNNIFQNEAAEHFAARQINPDSLSHWERAKVVWSVGPNRLWAVFQTMDLRWFVAGLACFGVVCWFGIYRWQLILRAQGLELRFRRAASIFFIGHFFNAFMLGATGGDIMKAWYAAHETHHKKAEAVATVIVDRIIGLLALFTIALIMMTIYWRRTFEDPKLVWFSIATLGVVAGTVLITVLGFWKGFADKLPGARSWLQRLPKYDLLRRMVEAYRTYALRPKLIWQTTLLSFSVHFFVILSIVCVGRGLKIFPANGLVDYFLYLPIINSISAVPITISGFGVREGMYAVMFGEVGVGQPQAVAMSLFGYLVALFWSIVGGGFFLTHRKEIPPVATIEKEE
jgi:hypothetical protein